MTIDLRNRFRVLQENSEEKKQLDIDRAWKEVATIYSESSPEKPWAVREEDSGDRRWYQGALSDSPAVDRCFGPPFFVKICTLPYRCTPVNSILGQVFQIARVNFKGLNGSLHADLEAVLLAFL